MLGTSASAVALADIVTCNADAWILGEPREGFNKFIAVAVSLLKPLDFESVKPNLLEVAFRLRREPELNALFGHAWRSSFF